MNANVLQPVSRLTIVPPAKTAGHDEHTVVGNDEPTVVGNDEPTVVITLPFEPKMTPRSVIEATLKEVQTRTVRQLMTHYSRDIALLLIHRLQELVFGLNFNTHKKGVALLVSAEVQRVLYLEQTLPVQVLVHQPFRIRELTAFPQNPARYLVLLLSGRMAKMYSGKGEELQLIKQNVRPAEEPCNKEKADKRKPCAGLCTRAIAHLDSFLREMDEGLSVVLNAYELPVFVVAHDKIVTRFATITRNDLHIAAYIPQNAIQSDEKDLPGALRPHLDDWSRLRRQIILKKVHAAQNTGKLSSGIDAVAKAVHNRTNRLLVVEKGFSDNGYPGNEKRPFFVKDNVDSIIGRVLDHGGQVEWVEPGDLDRDDPIVLIRNC